MCATRASGGSGQPAKVTDVLFIDENRVLITGGDGHVGVWSVRTGQQLMDFSGTVPYAWDSAFSASTIAASTSSRVRVPASARESDTPRPRIRRNRDDDDDDDDAPVHRARERDATAWENSFRVVVSTAPSDSTSRAARETAR